MDDFDGLVALVTGGVSGIGAATTEELATRGADVYVVDRDPAPSNHPHVRSLAGDVTRDAGIDAAITHIGAASGRLDVVINNAAISAVGDAGANDRDEWHASWTSTLSPPRASAPPPHPCFAAPPTPRSSTCPPSARSSASATAP